MLKFLERHMLIVALILCIIGGLAALSLPAFLTSPSFDPRFDFSERGQIGDTIGGIANPVVAYLAAIITFLAFWVQYRANQVQQEQLRDQANQFSQQQDLALKTQFDSKFYEMLRFHRENVAEIVEHRGGDAFSCFYDELRIAFHLVQLQAGAFRETRNTIISPDHVFQISFTVFFLGDSQIYYNDSSIFRGYDELFVNDCLDSLRKINLQPSVSIGSFKRLPSINIKRPFHYFAGHSDEIGHCIRHLYACATMIEVPDFLSNEEKQHYRRVLRAQLSLYEQIFMYYNAGSVFGRPWIENNYLQYYCKNIIPSLLYFGPSPGEMLGSTFVFEWQESSARF